MLIIALFITLLVVVDTLIFWSFTEAVRDKDFSEGMGIGQSFMHCGIATLIGIGVRLASISAPLHLFYLFKPFSEMGLNFVSKVICLVLMGAAEFGISLVMAKSLAAVMN